MHRGQTNLKGSLPILALLTKSSNSSFKLFPEYSNTTKMLMKCNDKTEARVLSNFSYVYQFSFFFFKFINPNLHLDNNVWRLNTFVLPNYESHTEVILQLHCKIEKFSFERRSVQRSILSTIICIIRVDHNFCYNLSLDKIYSQLLHFVPNSRLFTL